MRKRTWSVLLFALILVLSTYGTDTRTRKFGRGISQKASSGPRIRSHSTRVRKVFGSSWRVFRQPTIHSHTDSCITIRRHVTTSTLLLEVVAGKAQMWSPVVSIHRHHREFH
jgi:hypothetical protein